MALLWMDGFDHYGYNASPGAANMLRGIWADVNGNYPVSNRFRTGTGSARIFIQPFGEFRRIFGGEKEVVGLGYAFYFDSLPFTIYNGNMVQFKTAANAVVGSLHVTNTGAVMYSRTGYPTEEVARSADGVVVAAAWQHIEIKAKIHPTDGAVEVRVNGVTVLAVSGQNTGPSVPSQVSFGIRHGGGAAATGDHQFWVDDLFAWDDSGDANNDFIGDKRVGLIIPNDDTAQSDWTPVGSGTGFGAISEIPQDADATYIETQDVGHVSEFELQDVVGDIGAISAVQTYVIQRKTVAGVCNTQVGLISDSAETLGADRPITEQYTYYADVFETDPNTAAPWTKTGLSAARLKIERAA